MTLEPADTTETFAEPTGLREQSNDLCPTLRATHGTRQCCNTWSSSQTKLNRLSSELYRKTHRFLYFIKSHFIQFQNWCKVKSGSIFTARAPHQTHLTHNLVAQTPWPRREVGHFMVGRYLPLIDSPWISNDTSGKIFTSHRLALDIYQH